MYVYLLAHICCRTDLPWIFVFVDIILLVSLAMPVYITRILSSSAAPQAFPTNTHASPQESADSKQPDGSNTCRRKMQTKTRRKCRSGATDCSANFETEKYGVFAAGILKISAPNRRKKNSRQNSPFYSVSLESCYCTPPCLAWLAYCRCAPHPSPSMTCPLTTRKRFSSIPAPFTSCQAPATLVKMN